MTDGKGGDECWREGYKECQGKTEGGAKCYLHKQNNVFLLVLPLISNPLHKVILD